MCSCQHGKKDFFIGIYSWYGLDGLEQGGQENWDELVPAEKVIVKTDCSVSVTSSSPLYSVANGSAAPCSSVRRLVTLASKLIRTQWMKHEDERWIDETGRIVLLGDAAHPSYVSSTNPAPEFPLTRLSVTKARWHSHSRDGSRRRCRVWFSLLTHPDK